ncbi:E3 ubiquitin-protein ligase [Sesbania bispinosa]|nr:E3 ubiquitin-protein ligase [Sesbania bispinosa]
MYFQPQIAVLTLLIASCFDEQEKQCLSILQGYLNLKREVEECEKSEAGERDWEAGTMGSVCCCLSFDDFEDYYSSIFHRGEVHSIPSSIQGTASMTSATSLDNSLSDMYRSPPRPLPYDAEPRYFRSQRDGLVSRREKSSSHSNEETEPLRSDVDVDPESLSSGDKWNECTCEDGSKEYRSKSSLRLSSAKFTTGVGHVYSSSEEEDVCPTCLEEYTKENPR